MLEIIKYIFWGCVHFCIISFEFFDYIEQALIGLLIIFFIGMALWDRKFINMYLSIGKTFIKTVFSPFGIILLITMMSYYCFSIFTFEENINIVIIIITLALFCKDLFEFMNNSILDESKKTITSIMEICESVFVLFFYRFLYAIEFRNVEELNKVFYSLIFIPVIAIVITTMKILTTIETIVARYYITEKLENIDYLKLFLIILIKKKSINNTNQIINNFFRYNKDLTYYEAREKIMKYEFNNVINNKKNLSSKNIREKRKINIKSLWFILWIVNIVAVIYSIFEKRFYNVEFEIGYYISLAVLTIYFLTDILKIYRIQCQYDFIVYLVISIVGYIIFLIYYIQIQNGRLSNRLFLVTIYIIIAVLFRKTKTISFLDMPFLSEKNFFGLPAQKNISK